MKKVLLFLFVSLNLNYNNIVAAQKDVNIVAELDDDLMQQLEELPDDMVQPREFPWFIRVISKPGAYLFFNGCALWDWLTIKAVEIRNACSYLLCYLWRKNRDPEIKTAPSVSG